MRRKISIFVVIVVLIIIIAFFLLKLINAKVSPIIMKYSKSQIKKLAATIINKGITSEVIESINVDKLFIVDKSNSEEIITITLDPVMINTIEGLATNSVEKSLELIEQGDEKIYREYNINDKYFLVPTGIIFNSGLLNNIGPMIPIKLKMVGNVTSDIVTNVDEYGINNSLIKVSLEISTEIMVILPLSTDYVKITNYVPIAIKLIQGKVPIYYGNGFVLDKEKDQLTN